MARFDSERLIPEELHVAHPARGSTLAYRARSSDIESAQGLHTCTCMPAELHSTTRALTIWGSRRALCQRAGPWLRSTGQPA